MCHKQNGRESSGNLRRRKGRRRLEREAAPSKFRSSLQRPKHGRRNVQDISCMSVRTIASLSVQTQSICFVSIPAHLQRFDDRSVGVAALLLIWKWEDGLHITGLLTLVLVKIHRPTYIHTHIHTYRSPKNWHIFWRFITQYWPMFKLSLL